MWLVASSSSIGRFRGAELLSDWFWLSRSFAFGGALVSSSISGRFFSSGGHSQREVLVLGLKKKTLLSPVQTTHLKRKVLEIFKHCENQTLPWSSSNWLTWNGFRFISRLFFFRRHFRSLWLLHSYLRFNIFLVILFRLLTFNCLNGIWKKNKK